ncbi:hypothetical protein [Zobellella sp. An-6]|uniref:hypothetical protein n=1 Tax=Zobellella sp. An-6 TaxID=3400218 RepID=UPI0040418B98
MAFGVNYDAVLSFSLRAPKNNLYGAADFCSQFATGGGREGAAGVNALPEAELQELITATANKYG